IALAYATPDNVTGKPIYKRGACFLHEDALRCLETSITIAKTQGLHFRIFDAFRPTEAQQILWDACPNDEFVCPPERGSPHSRGVAVDLTLIDEQGNSLPMGTPFDDFTKQSHHGCHDLPKDVIANRLLLMGIMTDAGWDFYRNEWWHYQLFNARANYVL
ncbi:MAG: D-alanyl-D-alanine dipeptidase, partial [Phototrophicales bacterium]